MSDRERGLAWIEILVVMVMIAFVASALVVTSSAPRRAIPGAYLVQGLTTACSIFKDDWGYYPPDDWPIQDDSECVTPQNPIPASNNPSRISLRANANLALWLCYLYPKGHRQYLKLKPSELGGGFSKSYANMNYPGGAAQFQSAAPDPNDPNKGLVILDPWKRPIYYDCHTSTPGSNGSWRGKEEDVRFGVARVPGARVPIRNPKGGDIFTCGPDGLTAPNNKIDDDHDGAVDDVGEWALIGEDHDDINNWPSR